jgi:hypothetical protein
MRYIRLQRSLKVLSASCPTSLWLELSFPSYHLIGSLDFEEKLKAKDTNGKEIVGDSNANFVQKKNNFSNSHSKKKNKDPENVAKTK